MAKTEWLELNESITVSRSCNQVNHKSHHKLLPKKAHKVCGLHVQRIIVVTVFLNSL